MDFASVFGANGIPSVPELRQRDINPRRHHQAPAEKQRMIRKVERWEKEHMEERRLDNGRLENKLLEQQRLEQQWPEEQMSQQHMPQQQMPQQYLHQSQPSFAQWAPQPVTAYQMVPMSMGGGTYLPTYAQQIPQQMAQQMLQQQMFYQFPHNMAMQSMPSMRQMTPITPMAPMTPMTPIRQSFSNGSFYQSSPQQYQQFPGVLVQQQQQLFQVQAQEQQHQPQRSQSIPVMSSHVLPGSPEVSRALHLSPTRRYTLLY
jgi:hypothetical protein